MRIAVTGLSGQVAMALAERAALAGIEIETLARPDFDLARPAGLEDLLAKMRPDAIVNAAAYTAVDKAESEPALAHLVNAEGAGAVAKIAASLDIPVLHLSTDYVFDGGLDRPYRESDATGPISVYGQTKLDGEIAVAAATDNHAILRTSWVYSPFGKNFVRTMLMLAGKRDELSVVDDQRGAPTNALDLADGILQVARNLVERPVASELRGVFHMTGGGETNWAAFARAVFEASAIAGWPSAGVVGIPTSAYPTPARRPANSRLDNARLGSTHGVHLPHWQQSLGGCVERVVIQMRDAS